MPLLSDIDVALARIRGEITENVDAGRGTSRDANHTGASQNGVDHVDRIRAS